LEAASLRKINVIFQYFNKITVLITDMTLPVNTATLPFSIYVLYHVSEIGNMRFWIEGHTTI